MPRHYHVFSNAKAGNAASLSEVKRAFKAHDAQVSFHTITATLAQRVASLEKQKNIVLVAAGGDGTVNAIVNAAARSPHPVGVLPLGTLNHFAKDIGMPTDITEAVTELLQGAPTKLDVAKVNDHLFVNNSSIGFYPNMVTLREHHLPLLPKWAASFFASLAALGRIRRYHIRLSVDGKKHVLRSPFVFIGNNRYSFLPPNITERTTLTGGELSLQVVKTGNLLSVVQDVFRELFGHPKRNIISYSGKNIVVSMRRSRIRVAYDGEVSALSTPLNYQILPKKLHIITPKNDTAN
ncbi:MAG TPA: diacylglycerol kinase family protein [Candidatus Saccharimonadales bacterium]